MSIQGIANSNTITIDLTGPLLQSIVYCYIINTSKIWNDVTATILFYGEFSEFINYSLKGGNTIYSLTKLYNYNIEASKFP